MLYPFDYKNCFGNQDESVTDVFYILESEIVLQAIENEEKLVSEETKCINEFFS